MQQADFDKIKKRLAKRSRKYRKAQAGVSANLSDEFIRQRVAQLHGARRNRIVGLSNQLGIEHKYYDTTLVGSALANPTDCSGGELDPSATSMISTPAQGDTSTDRDGKKIIIDGVYIKFSCQRNGNEVFADMSIDNQFFIALVLDRQSNGAQLNSEDVFKNTGGSATTAVDLQRNLLFAKRFKVLRYIVVDMNWKTLCQVATNSFSATGLGYHFEWYVPFPKGLQVNFNSGTTASIVNVIDNSLHIVGFCNNATAGSNPGTLSYNARIRFRG